MNTKTVAVFGAFDGIHEGHLEFIKQARMHGDHIVAIVARDAVIERLKGKLPLHSEDERIKALLEVPDIDRVLLGDREEGEYKTLKEANPQVVFLGYDQDELSASIKIAIQNGVLSNIEVIQGEAHKPEIYHSSILNSHESGDKTMPEL